MLLFILSSHMAEYVALLQPRMLANAVRGGHTWCIFWGLLLIENSILISAGNLNLLSKRAVQNIEFSGTAEFLEGLSMYPETQQE